MSQAADVSDSSAKRERFAGPRELMLLRSRADVEQGVKRAVRFHLAAALALSSADTAADEAKARCDDAPIVAATNVARNVSGTVSTNISGNVARNVSRNVAEDADVLGAWTGLTWPARPEYAAREAEEMASRRGWREDEVFGHGFAAAAVAASASLYDIEAILRTGLSELPPSSSTARAVLRVLEIHSQHGRESAWNILTTTLPEWTDSNANRQVAAAVALLLFGADDWGYCLNLASSLGGQQLFSTALVAAVWGMRSRGKDGMAIEVDDEMKNWAVGPCFLPSDFEASWLHHVEELKARLHRNWSESAGR